MMWLTLASFVAFLASVFALTRCGFAPDGSLQRRGLGWVALAAASALLWVWSLPKVPPPYPRVRRYEAPAFPLPTAPPIAPSRVAPP